MTKLLLILDKSLAYINYVKDNTFKEWDITSDNVKEIQKFSQAGGATLFGDTPAYYIHISDKDSLTSIHSVLSTMDEATFTKRFSSGLIISSDMNKNSLKKLSNSVEKLNGKVHTTGKSKLDVSSSILSRIYLNKDAEEFLLAYVGEEYDTLIPLVSNIEKVPQDQQKKISVDSLMTRLPQKPGTIPGWEVSNAVFEGQASKAIELSRRVGSGNTPYLLSMYYIRSKVELLYRAAILLVSNPKISEKDAAEALNVNKNYGFTLALRKAKKVSIDDALRLAEIVHKYDSKMRGGERGYGIVPVDGMILLDAMIIELTAYLKG